MWKRRHAHSSSHVSYVAESTIRQTDAWFLVVTELTFFYLAADFMGGGLLLTFFSPIHFLQQ